MKTGSAIVWKKTGSLATVLSFILALKDPSWKARKWKGWHTGFIVKIMDTGEIVTFEAVNAEEGTRLVTYPNLASLGECVIYDWLDNADQAKVDNYVEDCSGMPYDSLAYVWVIITTLFNKDWSVHDKKLMCWENLANFFGYMGKQLEKLWKEPLISRMMNTLDTVSHRYYNTKGG